MEKPKGFDERTHLSILSCNNGVPKNLRGALCSLHNREERGRRTTSLGWSWDASCYKWHALLSATQIRKASLSALRPVHVSASSRMWRLYTGVASLAFGVVFQNLLCRCDKDRDPRMCLADACVHYVSTSRTPMSCLDAVWSRLTKYHEHLRSRV